MSRSRSVELSSRAPTAMFQSGAGAKYGTVLTQSYLFTNSAYDSEGVQIETSVGTAVKMCRSQATPAPAAAGQVERPQSHPKLHHRPGVDPRHQQRRRLDHAQGHRDLHRPNRRRAVRDHAPAVLKPAKRRSYQSGTGAKYGTILTRFIFTNSAYEKDGVRISTEVGTLYKACPPRRSRRNGGSRST